VFGLMLKDFFLIRKERTSILMVVLSVLSYSTLSSSPALALLMGTLPAYAITGWGCAFDYKYRADTFLNSLPASRSAIVGARYLLALSSGVLSLILAGAGWAVARLIGIGPKSAPFGFAAVVLGVGMALYGIYLCSYYLFGYHSARWANTIVFALVGLVGGSLGVFRGQSDIPDAAGMAAADLVSGKAPLGSYGAILGFGALVFGLSFLAARAKYRRAEF